MTQQEILSQVSQSTARFIDTANNGNINTYASKLTNGELIRVTTNPEGDAIISAGTAKINGLKNDISSGRFVPGNPSIDPATLDMYSPKLGGAPYEKLSRSNK
jgi:hypothetical protein